MDPQRSNGSDINVLQNVYHSVLVVQMKNCEPLVFGPEFAIESVPADMKKANRKSLSFLKLRQSVIMQREKKHKK